MGSKWCVAGQSADPVDSHCRDQFAAEYHSAGGVAIEIITSPAWDRFAINSTFLVRDSSLSWTKPIRAGERPGTECQLRVRDGRHAHQKTRARSTSTCSASKAYDTPNLNRPSDRAFAACLSLKAPRDNLFVNGQMDYALTLDQTLRFGYNLTRVSNDNLGVGGYDDRTGRTRRNLVHTLRVQHFGPVGPPAFWRSRVRCSGLTWTRGRRPRRRRFTYSMRSPVWRAARGGDHSRTLDVVSDLDYVLGRHSPHRPGADSMWYNSDATANYLGTYTFDNLQAYLATSRANYTDASAIQHAYDNFQADLRSG